MVIERLMPLGIILIFIGMIFLFIAGFYQAYKGSNDIKSAGIIFIGPFPIGWASDKRMFYVLIGFVIFVSILWIIFRRFIF